MMIHEPNTTGVAVCVVIIICCLAIIVILGIVLITSACVWPHTIQMYTVLLFSVAIAAISSMMLRAFRTDRIMAIYTDMCKIECA